MRNEQQAEADLAIVKGDIRIGEYFKSIVMPFMTVLADREGIPYDPALPKRLQNKAFRALTTRFQDLRTLARQIDGLKATMKYHLDKHGFHRDNRRAFYFIHDELRNIKGKLKSEITSIKIMKHLGQNEANLLRHVAMAQSNLQDALNDCETIKREQGWGT